MPQFLELPRELRDLIYAALITLERKQPSVQEVKSLTTYRRIFGPESSRRGEYGCAYCIEPVPTTIASFLACNRQVYDEMEEAIRIAKRDEVMVARLDCIAENQSFHYFTWLGIPNVHTKSEPSTGPLSWLHAWVDINVPRVLFPKSYLASRSYATTIPRLWIDIRLVEVEDRRQTWFRIRTSPERTAWAVCAALRRVFECGPDFSATKRIANTISVEELTLNVLTPPPPPSSANGAKQGSDSGDAPPAEPSAESDCAHGVAKELLNVWNRIWAGEDFTGTYQLLIERITRVQICINGERWRTRQLRLELERGQAELRRIAARVGW